MYITPGASPGLRDVVERSPDASGEPGCPAEGLGPPSPLEALQYRREPPVPRLPQQIHLPAIRFLDRVDQLLLLLRLELLPLGELSPPTLEGPEQVLEEPVHATIAGSEVVGQVRTGGGPAQRGAEGDGAVQVLDADDPLDDQVDALAPDGRGDASDHVARHRLLQDDRHPAQLSQVVTRACDRGGV